MNTELQSIIAQLQETLTGHPWYGEAVYTLLDRANPADVYKKPGDDSHSMADLLYHMLNWAEFTLENVRGNPEILYFDKKEFDWRVIHPSEHGWEAGLIQLKATFTQLIAVLETKDDSLLNKTAVARKYNYRTLLNGIIQHNIYHIGQIAYLEKIPLKF